MLIKIGERELAIARPADLDGVLTTDTGCTAAEHAAMLTRHPTPVAIAAALAPFVTGEGAPSRAELASMIVDLPVEQMIAVRGQVVELLDEAVAVAASAPAVPLAQAHTA